MQLFPQASDRVRRRSALHWQNRVPSKLARLQDQTSRELQLPLHVGADLVSNVEHLLFGMLWQWPLDSRLSSRLCRVSIGNNVVGDHGANTEEASLELSGRLLFAGCNHDVASCDVLVRTTKSRVDV